MNVEFLEIGFALVAFAIVFGFVFGAGVARSGQLKPLGYWPVSWALLVMSGIARLTGHAQQVDLVTGVLVSTFMLAGALSHVGRANPRWLMPAAITTSVIYLILDAGGYGSVARLASLVTEPQLLAVAAYVVYSAPVGQRTFRYHNLLAPCFIAMVGLDIFDWFSGSDDVGEIAVWLVVAVPICLLQAAAMFYRTKSVAADAARALEHSVSLLQATLESTADGILVVDRHGGYTSFNRTFGEMWRIPQPTLDRGFSQEVLQTAMLQLKDPGAFYDKVQTLYADSQAESFDTLDFVDGRVYERYSRPQRIGDEVVGRVWSFRDVTERASAEAAATIHQDHLEELVEDRTRELVESRDQLQRADRLAAIGILAAGVAHQINNPVGSILMSAEYGLVCENDEDVKKTWKRTLEVCAEEARRCAAIVRSMLQFAREENVERRVEDLNDVVQRASRATSDYARECNAKTQVLLAEPPLLVEMSAIQIEQVLVNLIRNAVESGEGRGAVVSICTRFENDLAIVDVCDDGCGIDPKDLSRVFDPFFSTRLRVGGTGLGLSVVHGVVSDHGGEIRVLSELNQGTTITVELCRWTGDDELE